MLYIMRHGKTEWNKKKKLQGRTDIPLCREGIEMAEKAREEYKDVHLDICYCSPLIRTRKTAEILLEGRNVPIVTDDRLKEMCFTSTLLLPSDPKSHSSRHLSDRPHSAFSWYNSDMFQPFSLSEVQ